MVIKTEVCAFSEFKIYPGNGSRFVTRTGQLVILSSAKSKAMFHQHKKPALLRWTLAWRRGHKKINNEGQAKRKVRRVVKVTRGIVGASVDELKAMRAPTKPKETAPAAATDAAAAKKAVVKQAAVAEAKAKAKQAAAQRKAAGKAAGAAAGKARMPAAQKHAGKGR